MPDQNGDKSQDPTPHRRRKAREEGQVARSQDLSSAALLLVGVAAFFMLGERMAGFLLNLGAHQLGTAPTLAPTVQDAVAQWHAIVEQLLYFVVPIMAVMFVAGILVNLMQVGILFLPQKLAMDISRLDPLSGAQRVFSLASVMRLAFGLFKVVVVAAVALAVLYAHVNEVLGLAAVSIGTYVTFIFDILLMTSLKIGIALLILAILDYAFQYWKQEQDLKMTHQEVREEMKNLEGDPQVAAKRRQVQRQLVMNRMGEAVPSADVVVTNPTELAVAIKYDAQKMEAPIVVAKGAGAIAQRIRRLALEHGIPIVERKPLAQALYKHCDINQAIPPENYAAVAEVLAYVYQLKGKKIPEGMPRQAA